MRHTSLAGLVNDATVGVDDAEDKDGGGEGVPGDQHEDDDGGSELGEVSERAVRAVELPGGAVLDHDDGGAVRLLHAVAVHLLVDGHVGAEVLVRPHDLGFELHRVCADREYKKSVKVSRARGRHEMRARTHKS